ncbi:hypothetical protein TSAR_007558 [Trichomalopsis sarcophagae]|uniref:Uncharacterized protein n=1 Tax=Trichomalopsis sarcophagae TaxID=543379 RepID=A0A232FE82_9HYME|nr:hypothetical protein TSAR_007558 [Trichomalopsis sarcophagae]
MLLAALVLTMVIVGWLASFLGGSLLVRMCQRAAPATHAHSLTLGRLSQFPIIVDRESTEKDTATLLPVGVLRRLSEEN